MARKKSAKTKITLVCVYVLVCVLGICLGFGGLSYLYLPKTDVLVDTSSGFYSYNNNAYSSVDLSGVSSDLTVHFVELGNKYTGDCTYIKVGENVDILIDCGSRSSSIPTVVNYLNNYVKDNTLEYVIITHAHQDHYAGFATGSNVKSIFEYFDCKTIIDFPKTNKEGKTLYEKYVAKRDAEIELGAKHYTALECYNAQTPAQNGAARNFELSDGVSLEILYHEFYETETSNENDYSVACMINQEQTNGSFRRFLFTGDLDADGETSLKDRYIIDHPENTYGENGNFKVQLYKAGHHGSGTSSNADFLEVFRPEICCVCCCAGSPEYTKTSANQFPTQEFINRISVYTQKVYVTTLCLDYDAGKFVSMNGNIAVCSLASEVKVKCSNNDTLLKDTEWFKQNRTTPEKWQTVAIS